MNRFTEIKEFLKAPFAPTDIEWRVDGRAKEAGQTVRKQAMPYVSSRAIMDRLDAVVASGLAESWHVDYTSMDLGNVTQTTYKGTTEVPCKGMVATITITYREPTDDKATDEFIYGRAMTGTDGADLRSFASFKSAFTDSIKRAGVPLGIGRYLYNVPISWVEVDNYGRFNEPKLPVWALPKGYLDEHPEYGSTQTQNADPMEEQGVPFASAPSTPAKPQGDGKFRFKSGKQAGKSFDEIDDKGWLEWLVDKSNFNENLKAQARARLEELG